MKAHKYYPTGDLHDLTSRPLYQEAPPQFLLTYEAFLSINLNACFVGLHEYNDLLHGGGCRM